MSAEWPKVPLGDVLTPISRPVTIEPNETYRILGAHLYAQGLYTKEVKDGSQIRAKTLYRIEEGDFVYNRLFAWKGSFAIATDENDGCYASNEFPCFSINRERVDGQYLWRYFSRASAWNEALGLSTGGTPISRNRLKENKFLAMKIPLPPLDEQRRTVARIEELAARIEEARKLGGGGAEEAEAILSSAKNALFSKEHMKQWKHITLGEIADIQSGVTLGRKLRGPTIKLPYLRVANVQDGYLDLKTIKKVEILEDEHDKWQLLSGDILLTEGGDWDKLGRGTVWHGEIEDCIHQNHIFRVRVNLDEFDPDYLCALIGSPYGKAYFQSASKQTTNLATINQRQLKAFVIFYPAIDEQRRIVARLDELLAQVDGLKKHQVRTAEELDALLPAVLDRAFRGQL